MKLLTLALLLLLAVPAAAATPDAAAQREITHLFRHLEQSGCRFFRNGSWYDARDAAAHLQKKYEYLLKKELVGSAEDFIARAAAESSMSGKPYLVKCGTDAAVPSKAWFGAELGRLRRTRP